MEEGENGVCHVDVRRRSRHRLNDVSMLYCTEKDVVVMLEEEDAGGS